MKNIFVDRIKEYSSEKLAFTLLDNGIVSKTISYEELYDSYLEYKTLFENIKMDWGYSITCSYFVKFHH